MGYGRPTILSSLITPASGSLLGGKAEESWTFRQRKNLASSGLVHGDAGPDRAPMVQATTGSTVQLMGEAPPFLSC